MLAKPPVFFPMNPLSGRIVGIIILFGTSLVWGAPSAVNQTTVPDPTPYAITAQDGNSRVWERTTYQTDPSGNLITNIQSYSELASGLNHWVNGQWVASDQHIDILPNGTAVATNGQHQVTFPGDIYNGEIELVTPEGLQLESRPMGLSYFDGTNSVLIAELTNSIGQVLGDNQVIYTNAFTDFACDLRYTYTIGGFEQDIILREQPPTPESLGLNPATARLQLLTEFFSPPQPTLQADTLPPQAGVSLVDQSLGFGTMQMVQGRAFLLGENAQDTGVAVAKSWLLLDGRQFLVEEVPVNAIADTLGTLPMPAQTGTMPTVSRQLALPPQRLVKNNVVKPKLLARTATPARGFVLDYQTVNSSVTNYTFQGDTTYYISGNVYLYGTNTFEGGTVIKYATNSSLYVYTTTNVWLAGSYRPVIFTAKDDNSVGDTISGSTGSPAGYYANTCIFFGLGSSIFGFSNFRMSYANYGILWLPAGTHPTYADGQFVNCGYGIVGATTYLRNLLFSHVTNDLNAINGTFDAQNCTFDSGNTLMAGNATAFAFTNCLFANLTNITTPSGSALYASHNGFYNSGGGSSFGASVTPIYSNPFQTVGGGNYYLTSSSGCQGAGTTNIDPNLLASLQTRTTYPPILYSNYSVSVASNWNPQARRDGGSSTLDLGYHYDPIDYAVGGVDLYANVNVTNGAVVGWFEALGGQYSAGQGYGLSLNNGADLTFHGTATAPCWMVKYDTVQEGNWTARGWMGGIMINGSGTTLNGQFTKWSVLSSDSGHYRDYYAEGASAFSDCEFYIGNLSAYDQTTVVFTNCLLFRDGVYFFSYASPNAQNITIQNCTFYDGFLAMNRYSGQPPTVWTIIDTAFDGTGFSTGDNLNGSATNIFFNYNAYNTNNQSGLAYAYPYTPPPTNRLENIGPQDVFTGTYNWQTSWFGNFYQPTNGPLLNMGNTNANLLGLYHFTTQTNQVPEGTNIVDIGYHYVATGTNGVPLDTDGDGIPDYLEDSNGDGVFDAGDLGNWLLSPYNGLSGSQGLLIYTPLK
jgi:hypothetical protein